MINFLLGVICADLIVISYCVAADWLDARKLRHQQGAPANAA
jgi:hypothetical protein